ncbi:hypothetical protein K504DRAFT_408226 [Pleomassaria siparia CBS 279.74]|uniref:DUF2293 domain-containing protein n=1 Tax=Pleomassaria siparia CBS 279.74 TaxID=1314801 RepID=A0A6G1K7R2_9PLEO|nr:hypothetical protein K504DRAFT_408226 [Pleomassaria siparia CBS 279.74]
MTRVYPIRRQPHRASALDRSRIIRKKKPYKVVLEAVTQERKKLHSFTTYRENAPPGYVFVPVGHPDLTEYCKDRCREWNLDAIIVSAKPRSKALENTEKISHHVHRLGFHFPAQVISEACDVLGYKYRNNHFYKRARDLDLANTRLARSLATHGERALLHGRPATEAESKTQVRDAVRDLFPKIPEQDLSAIVHHAFAEGSTRVGNAKELTLARRVQLAVVAHIRHTYTEYDSLLKTGSWSEARSKVEHVSLAVLRRWRDEGDDVEETFREVIVIDDDDDDEEESSDDDDEDFFSEADQREHSLEIISSRATARELQLNEPEHPVRVDAHGVGRAQRRIIYLSTQPVSRPYVVAGAPNAYPTNQESRAHARPLLPIAPIRYSPQYPALHNRPVVS